MTTIANYKQQNPSAGFGGCLLWFAMMLLPIIYGCRTSHELTTQYVERDTTSKHVRDSATQVITELVQRHELDIQAIKNTGVMFAPNCDTIIIDAHCNYDSVQGLIARLRNRVTINANGSIEAEGRLAGAYSNMNSLQHELSIKDSINQRLAMQHSVDSASLHTATAATRTVDKSKPGGIFGALPWLLIAILVTGILSFSLGYKWESMGANKKPA